MKKMALCVKSSLKSGSEYFGAPARQTKKKRKKEKRKKPVFTVKTKGGKIQLFRFLKNHNKFLREKKLLKK